MQIRENNVLLHSKTVQKWCPQNPKFEIFCALFSGFIGQFFSVYTWIILFKTNKSQCKNAFDIHISYIYFLQKTVIQ